MADTRPQIFWSSCLLLVVIFAGFSYVECNVIFNPKEPKFSVTNAFLTQFNYTTTDQTLDFNLALNITITNPNKRVDIEYRDIQVTAMYIDKTFALVRSGGRVTHFYEGHENTTVLQNLHVQGKQLVKFGEAELRKFKSQTDAGIYSIDLQLALQVKPRYDKSFKSTNNKNAIHCKLMVPLTTFGTSAGGNGGGGCEGGFNTTKCFNTHTFLDFSSHKPLRKHRLFHITTIMVVVVCVAISVFCPILVVYVCCKLVKKPNLPT